MIFYGNRKQENRQNLTLLNRNRSCPSLSFKCPELLSRVLEKNLNMIDAVAFQQNRMQRLHRRIIYQEGRVSETTSERLV